MFATLRNAWKIPDLKKKLLFTLLIIVLYRLGCAIPIPYVNSTALSTSTLMAGGIFAYLNILTGSAFSNATLFALGINPYITASIVMQLLTIAIPYLENLAKEGEEGQKKINAYTRYVTVALGLVTAIGYRQLLASYGLLINTGWFATIVVVACYGAGAALVMWLSEKINENGIGNGISMILFANIVSRLPSFAMSVINMITGKGTFGEDATPIPIWLGIIIAIVAIIVAIAMIAFIVWMTNSERRIPIQYAKKGVGRKMYGGQSSNLPIKVNMVGVMPIIFASSICSIMPTVQAFINPTKGSRLDNFFNFFGPSSWFYALMTFVLIIAFAYFYTSISFNPVEVSNNLKTNGGSVPGIRPGRPTAEYITKILNRITLIGALLLSVVAVLPMIVNIVSGGTLSSLAFGGSSIIIVVGVVLETIREIEAQMTMRHYKGFLG
ncbi:MAG: preprotein translocase subunit SecY [Clostridiales bacterium]|nr:preprotein translocase subunit SecY [Clostridiales bacterium]